MKFILISDSHDALTGMRLAGIEGVFAGTSQAAEAQIQKYIADESVGIILVTQGLASGCAELIDSLKPGSSKLVVTVPGSKDEESPDNIMRYVHEAIGIKI